MIERAGETVLQKVQAPNTNVLGMAILLRFVVSFGSILSVNSSQVMAGYGTMTFAERDFVGTGMVLSVDYVLMLVFGVRYLALARLRLLA